MLHSVMSDSLRPMDCSPPGSSVHGIFQARILEWVAISYSRGSSRPRDQIQVSCVSCISRQILYHRAIWEAPYYPIYTMLYYIECIISYIICREYICFVTSIPHFPALYCASQIFIFFLTNQTFVATLHQASLLVVFFQQHLLMLCLCHILVIPSTFQTFSLLLYLQW